GSADADQVDHEDQGLAGLDRATGAAVAVPEVRWDDALTPATDLHPLHTGVPPLDDLADAELEGQRHAPVLRRVELLAGRVGHAHVVHVPPRPGLGLVAVTHGDV